MVHVIFISSWGGSGGSDCDGGAAGGDGDNLFSFIIHRQFASMVNDQQFNVT